jgi:hypothetical protein
MEEVRPEPALLPEGIDDERLQIWIQFDFGNEVEWRILPPIYLTRCERIRRIHRIRDVPPDHLIEVHLLAAGRAARRLIARDIVGVPYVDDLLTGLPLIL